MNRLLSVSWDLCHIMCSRASLDRCMYSLKQTKREMKLKFLNRANKLNTKESWGLNRSGTNANYKIKFMHVFGISGMFGSIWEKWEKEDEMMELGRSQRSKERKGWSRGEKEAAMERRAVLWFSPACRRLLLSLCWMINVLRTLRNKVFQINGCLREISSLVQLSAHSGAVSTGI